jgi:hypothetical protein
MNHAPRPTLCSVEDCEQRATAKGLCPKHYARLRRHGDVHVSRWEHPAECSVQDCQQPTHAKGLCNRHYRRVARHGDVNASRQARRAKSARETVLTETRSEVPRWPETERTCRKCGETKPINDFAKGDGGHLRRDCKDCKAEQHRQWRARNPEHVREWHRKYGETPERKAAHRDRQRHYYYNDPQSQRAKNMRRRGYRIGPDEYDAMLAQQNGVCAICGDRCKSGRALAVDHDHVTGEVRGLLCMNCNRAIGWLNDDPDLIMRAAEYVLSYRNGRPAETTL